MLQVSPAFFVEVFFNNSADITFADDIKILTAHAGLRKSSRKGEHCGSLICYPEHWETGWIMEFKMKRKKR
jgi:hypothetical protein